MRSYVVYDVANNRYLVKLSGSNRFTWGKKVDRFGSAIALTQEQADFWVGVLSKVYDRSFVTLSLG